jgi:CDP-diacylglycerol--serine O-phosphatidyltransferase
MIKLLSFADIISLTNAIFGFLAILVLFSDITSDKDLRIYVSFSLILIAILIDGLDGIIARKFRKSEIGDHMESMADMISLGISPAFFIYYLYSSCVSYCIYYHSILAIILILFLSMSIIRLASFHKMSNKDFFIGLPASASTTILLTLAILKIEFIYLLIVIIIISFALISNIHFPKPGYKIKSIATILIILTLLVGKNYENITIILLFLAISAYTIIGPIYLIKNKKRML